MSYLACSGIQWSGLLCAALTRELPEKPAQIKYRMNPEKGIKRWKVLPRLVPVSWALSSTAEYLVNGRSVKEKK